MIYLAGPINGCDDGEVLDWRRRAIELLAPFSCIDPSLWDFRGKEAENATEIVERDLDLIAQSRVVLANCWKPSVGTSMEIRFAYDWRVPVVTIATGSVSPWLTYHSRVVVPTLKEAIPHVIELVQGAA